jgi:glycine/D-amino acid oxidase-like deaminating enzyme
MANIARPVNGVVEPLDTGANAVEDAQHPSRTEGAGLETRYVADRLRDARIVVIGAGVVGAALSYRLAQAGAQVTTVERRYPGAGTSGASFAWLNGFNKTPRHYHRLNIHGIRDHQDLADELDGDWVHVDGALHWAHDRPDVRVTALRQTVRRLREWGMHVDRTTPEVVMRELEPDLRIDPDAVSEVYVVPREGWLETITMASATLRAARLSYGARYERAAVIDLRVSDGAVDSVVLDDGRELSGDIVINAAGPDAGRIAELAGARLPLDRQIGMLVVTAPAPVQLRRVLYGEGAHARPEGGGRLMLHPEWLDGHAVEGEIPPLDASFVRRSMDEARAALPGLVGVPAEAVRVGLRSMPRDGLPIIGFDPAMTGLYTCVTHSGVSLAARLALLVTEELCGGDASELAPYRPDRFGGVPEQSPGAATPRATGWRGMPSFD